MPLSAAATVKQYQPPKHGQPGFLIFDLVFSGAYSDGRIVLPSAQMAKTPGLDDDMIDALEVIEGPDNLFRLLLPTAFPSGASHVPSTVITALGAGASSRPRLTSNGHELSSGDRITVSGFTGDPAGFNGAWTAEVITANTFDLREAFYDGQALAGSPVYVPVRSKRILGYARLVEDSLSHSQTRVARQVVTLAQLNAGQVITNLEAVSGRQFGIVDYFIKFNGAFATATDIRLSTTEGSPTDIVTIPIAQAGDNVSHGRGINSANHTENDAATLPVASLAAGAGVQLRKTGSSATGGTDVEVMVEYLITTLGTVATTARIKAHLSRKPNTGVY